MTYDTSSLQLRMRRLFTEAFTVMDLAEPILSFDAERPAEEVRAFMAEREMRIVGVREDGVVTGFACAEDLVGGGDLAAHGHPFSDGSVVSDSACLPEVFRALIDARYCFVSILGEIGAIVSRSDVSKPPVRMWLFGMITILEMFLTRTVQERLPGDSWQERLSAGRLQKAELLQGERRRRGQQVALLDCVQLPDKALVLLKDPESVVEFGFASRREGEKTVKALESLRNNLAHAQDIVTHDWQTILDLSNRLDVILTRL